MMMMVVIQVLPPLPKNKGDKKAHSARQGQKEEHKTEAQLGTAFDMSNEGVIKRLKWWKE